MVKWGLTKQEVEETVEYFGYFIIFLLLLLFLLFLKVSIEIKKREVERYFEKEKEKVRITKTFGDVKQITHHKNKKQHHS